MPAEKELNTIVASFDAPVQCVLSKQTLDVLQNMSMFCTHFVSDEKDHIRMFVPGAIIIYDLPEEERLPDFAIPSIAAFMNTCSVFEPDELSFAFTDKFVQISDLKSYLRFLYVVNKEILHLPKSYDFPSTMFKGYSKYQSTVNLTTDVINKLKKVSSFMDLKMLEIEMVDGKGTLTLRNPDVGFDSIYSVEVEGTGTCSINIQIVNMKFITGDYTCSFDESRIQFLNNEIPLRYIIAKSVTSTDRKDK